MEYMKIAQLGSQRKIYDHRHRGSLFFISPIPLGMCRLMSAKLSDWMTTDSISNS